MELALRLLLNLLVIKPNELFAYLKNVNRTTRLQLVMKKDKKVSGRLELLSSTMVYSSTAMCVWAKFRKLPSCKILLQLWFPICNVEKKKKKSVFILNFVKAH